MDEHVEPLPRACPRFMEGEDGSIEELKYNESAMLGFRRCLPEDLKAEFDKVFHDDGRAFKERMEAFTDQAHPRRDEIVAAGWEWWA